MRIAFYAPLKAPDHPVPSGDREMARLLMTALTRAGHEVSLLSDFRSYSADPAALDGMVEEAGREVVSIASLWRSTPHRRPDLVFTYHLYYKAPDLVGHPLAALFDLPYVTAEASSAAKRRTGPWTRGQALVEAAVRAASVNFCFTENDRLGLAEIVMGDDRLLALPPFIDVTRFKPRDDDARSATTEIVTLAMMRSGDKLRSYRFLAASVARLKSRDWRLTLIGDGPARPAVEAAFADFPPGQIRWRGALAGLGVADALRAADILAWPGINEAFGVSYLEAQACGLPVVALHGEGTPSVVRDGVTGLLADDRVEDYANNLDRLVADPATRLRLGRQAADFVHGERSLEKAAATIGVGLRRAGSTFEVDRRQSVVAR